MYSDMFYIQWHPLAKSIYGIKNMCSCMQKGAEKQCLCFVKIGFTLLPYFIFGWYSKTYNCLHSNYQFNFQSNIVDVDCTS
jgi:hypothetical protein